MNLFSILIILLFSLSSCGKKSLIHSLFNTSRDDSNPSSSKSIIQCPTGYIPIPNDPTYNTDDFCVMKFEAKDVGGVATSQTALTPWVNISYTDAKTECQNLGAGHDLISNPEWMTIARNIENQNYNWSGNLVGSGELARGHSENGPIAVLSVSNELDEYDQTGDNSSSGWEQRRTSLLSNGELLWDLAGNASEIIDWYIPAANKAYVSADGSPQAAWREFNTVDTRIGVGEDMEVNSWQAINTSLTSVDGIGSYFSEDNISDGYAVRGGAYFQFSNGGIYSLFLITSAGSVSTRRTFRCTYKPQ